MDNTQWALLVVSLFFLAVLSIAGYKINKDRIGEIEARVQAIEEAK